MYDFCDIWLFRLRDIDVAVVFGFPRQESDAEKSQGSKHLYFRKIGTKIERFLALPGERARSRVG